MLDLIYAKVLVLHVISVMVAVGTVTVTDYLHILGLRDPRLEKRSLFVFPHLSKLIVGSLVIIYATGAFLVWGKPSLLVSGLFWVKLSLVLIVTINGFILHHKIFPQIEKSVKSNTHNTALIKQAAFGGSLSVVSWYGIVILALTKTLGYTPMQFIIAYIFVLVIAYFVAVRMELGNKINKK